MTNLQKLKAEELLTVLQLLVSSKDKTLQSQEFNKLFEVVKPVELNNYKAILSKQQILSYKSQGQSGGWSITYISSIEPNIKMCERTVNEFRSKKKSDKQKAALPPLASIAYDVVKTNSLSNVIEAKQRLQHSTIKTQEQFLQQVKELKSEFEKNTSFKVNLDISFSIVQKHSV